jgi:hypothetical protein
MKENNYLDQILKESLSGIKIYPNRSWSDLYQKISRIENVKKINLIDKIVTNSVLKIVIGTIVVLSIITGSAIVSGLFNNNIGLSPITIVKDTTIKSTKIIQYDLLEKERKDTVTLENNQVKIKVNVPIHKNVIIRKKIILTDSINN